jgi:hypothetical protein
LALSSCAGDALPPSPTAAASADEARITERLRRHLASIPGVGGASVLVHVPPRDPFARTIPPAPARASIVIVTAAGADIGALGDTAQAAARTILGDDAQVEVQLTPPPPRSPSMARVGPFRVAASSRGPLIATLALALTAIAALAAALAWALYRRGISPHQSSDSTTRGS